MHHLGYCQIAQLLAHPHQLIDYCFKLPHGLNLPTIQRDQRGIRQPHRNGFVSFLAGQQGVRAALDTGTIGMFDRQELLGE